MTYADRLNVALDLVRAGSLDGYRALLELIEEARWTPS
jgi:hypothetical protein